MTPRLRAARGSFRPGRRRALGALLGATGLLRLGMRPVQAAAVPQTLRALVEELTGGAALQAGRVKLELPQIAENGNSVPLKVSVESPMTQRDHVTSITLLSEKNPRPVIARFFIGPRAGRAEINTRIRLAATQSVLAIAQLSDGTFWSDSAPVLVSMAACIDGS